MGATLQEPIALQGEQVMVDGGSRGQSDLVRDLADAGRIPALGHCLRDAPEDLLLAFGVMPGQPWLLGT